MPDIFLYCSVAVLSGPLLVVVYRRQQLGVTVSIIMTILLLIVDLGLVMYHGQRPSLQTQLRPAYTTYILLVIYSFLPIVRNRQAVLLGIIVSLCHLSVLASVTYKSSPNILSLVSVFFCLVIYSLILTNTTTYTSVINLIQLAGYFSFEQAVYFCTSIK